ncbi:MAG: glutathione S-transferase [Hyphomicrobiales bacterium]|nr:glutathione S-transferase [Hyphomicrobiales bacterium]
MKLFTIPGTCALSVHIVLEWIGTPYELDVMARGDNTSAAYLAINPSGQVPALGLEDGKVLTEAAAILTYLADLYPEADLANGSSDSYARYELIQLLSILTGEVHVAFKPFFAPQRFLGDEAQFLHLKDQAFETLKPLLARLDERLGAARWILNDRRSVADAYLYVLLRWVDYAPYGIKAFPDLARFRLLMEDDPAVQAALRAQGMNPVGAGA